MLEVEVEQVEGDHSWHDDGLEEVYHVVLQLLHMSSYNKNAAEAESAMKIMKILHFTLYVGSVERIFKMTL